MPLIINEIRGVRNEQKVTPHNAREIEKLKEMVSVLLKPGQTRKDVEEQARLKIMLKQELKKLGIVTHVEDKKGKRTIKPA